MVGPELLLYRWIRDWYNVGGSEMGGGTCIRNGFWILLEVGQRWVLTPELLVEVGPELLL